MYIPFSVRCLILVVHGPSLYIRVVHGLRVSKINHYTVSINIDCGMDLGMKRGLRHYRLDIKHRLGYKHGLWTKCGLLTAVHIFSY